MRAYPPAPMSVSLALMTGILVAIGVVGLASVPILISLMRQGVTSRLFPDWPVVLLVSVVIFWITILICWQARPNRYELRDDSLVIIRSRPFRDVTIPLSDIREVTRVKPHKAWKIFGISGAFSDTGWFKNKELGKFFASITDWGRAVLLSNGQRYAISPKYPDEFVADLKRIIRQV